MREKLGWEPWSGAANGTAGQQEILDAYTLALRQLHERDAWEHGHIGTDRLRWWKPGQVIQNVIRVEAGHTTGKTHMAAGLVNHFFDNFIPCVGYCFAPTFDQIHDLLFKNIKTQRKDRNLPGRVLDLEIQRAADHFIKGRAASNADGRGTERVQGQHGQYNLYILDEAEGVADFVFDAIRSMTSGGISIILMLANPRTRSSRFHKIAQEPHVRSFRMSCLNHPNVVEGREVVPGAVRRQYVEEMLEAHCQVVPVHNPDLLTFEIPWRPGEIFEPDTEFLFRVLGIAPAAVSDRTLIPIGRYEAAVSRTPSEDRPHLARLGVDCARFGSDAGTIYCRHNGQARRVAKLTQADTNVYLGAIREEAKRLASLGVTSLHVRVDGGGGFGSGIIDGIKADLNLRKLIPDLRTFEVHFNGTPRDGSAFADWITEATADVAESLKTLAIERPPNELEADLTEREYDWVNRSGVAVKALEQKGQFRKRQRPERSPDDGDGFVLACVSDHLVQTRAIRQVKVEGLI